jgi:hypothetical protein
LIAVRLTTAVMRASLRCATVAVAICSWIAISNHCAFAAIATRVTGFQPGSYHRQDADATECPFHSKPDKSKEPPAGTQCCKLLRAIVFESATNSPHNDGKLSNVDFPIEEFILHSEQHHVAPLLLDTGPPGACSFAELILQRSLLAHAPPAVA